MERFWSKVDKRGPDDCWEWIGAKASGARPGKKPYGQLWTEGSHSTRKRIKAHRLSYELHYGPIPEGRVVMHKCNNPGCVNPAHLTVGTPKQNLQDASDDGLFRARKLTTEDVEDILWVCGLGANQSEVARQYGVHHSLVNGIVRGRRRVRS